jgi:hypothetical protein
VSRCRSCRAPTIWARTVAGRRLPLDLEPIADGNVIIRNGVAMVLRVGQVVADDEPCYVAHFATCPDEAAWRRGSP